MEREEDIVLVYTMAKVASLSVHNSIKKTGKIHSFHEHTLDIKKIEKAFRDCRARKTFPSSKSVGHLIYQHKIEPGKKIKIITAVREPIARNFSAFFDVLPFYTGKNANVFSNQIEALFPIFYKSIPHDFPLNWFDREFNKMTSIDLYKKPFDHKKKYQFYKKDQAEVLLFRVDLEDEIKEKVIAEFLGLKSFKLERTNVGKNKPYAKVYKEFKEKIKIEEEYLANMMESKYTKHFYSKEEIARFYEFYRK